MEADEIEPVLQGLEKAREFAKSYRFQMTDEYRALIALVEGLPQNQSGADKSGLWRGSLARRRTWFSNIRLIPRSR